MAQRLDAGEQDEIPTLCPRCGMIDEPHFCRPNRQQDLIDLNHPDQKRYDR